MNLDYLEITEQDFTLHRDGKPIMVGHPDSVRVYESRRIVAVMERKFGYKMVQSADANLQLRAYLVLAAGEYPADLYYGCLTQPRVSSQPHIVRYTPADIVMARREIELIYDACFASNPPRKATPEGCLHCAAQAVCEEFISWAFSIRKAAHLPAAQWTDEQWDHFLTLRPVVEKFCKERLEDAKIIKQANPERLPGWSLKPGNEVRTVTDLVAAWGALQTYMSPQEFSGECDVSITGLVKLIWQKYQDNPALGKLTQKGANALINEILASVIEKKRNKPSLEKE